MFNAECFRQALSRRTFLSVACEENHLAGMTGRGAPHVFAFDRRGELPGDIQAKIPRSRFWKPAPPDDNDVILRTKRFMSDSQWSEPLLYMPAALRTKISYSGAVPEVTLEDRDHDPAAAENWLKYARLMREEPYCMEDAACHLEKLARQELPRGPLLDVSRCLPSPGPAVGPGQAGSCHAGGQNLDYAPNVLQLRRESLGKAVLDRYRKATLRSGVYRAAAKLWASGVLSWEDALQAVEDALGVNLDDTA